MTRANSVHPVTQADSNSLVPDLSKVGSYPNDDNFVHFCFVLFCVLFIKKIFSESVPAKKNATFC